MVDRHGRCVCCRKTEVFINYEISYYRVNNTRLTSFYNDIFHIPPCHLAMVIIFKWGFWIMCIFAGGFASSVTELSLIMLIAAKLSFCVGAFCVLTVWSARLYKTHRLPLAARENTDCADWVEELYVLGSWNDVIKIRLRFVDLLLISKWEPQQSSCFLQPSKLPQYYRHWQLACELPRLLSVRQNICLGQQYDGCDGVMIRL